MDAVEKLTERQLELWVFLAEDMHDRDAARIGLHVARVIAQLLRS